MLTADQIRLVLPALLGLPVLAAIVLRFLDGPRARVGAVAFTVFHLVLTFVVVLSAVPSIQGNTAASEKIDFARRSGDRVFIPQFVPGDPAGTGSGSYSTSWDLLTFHGPDPNAASGR